MNWRNNLDSETRKHLETLIANTHKFNSAYNEAKNPALAQLWCAVGVLSKQLTDINKPKGKTVKKVTKPKTSKKKPVKKKVKKR